MENLEFPTTAGEIARGLGAELVGDDLAPVVRFASLNAAGSGSLSFFAHRKYAEDLASARSAVVLTSPELIKPELPITYIVVPDPKKVFAGLLRSRAVRHLPSGISPLAVVDSTATIAASASIGPYVVVGPGVVIGPGTRIFPHAYLGKGVSLGSHCEIHPQVTVWDGVQVGDRVKIFAGCVIGSDGFGYVEREGVHEEVPQVGVVVIEDDVRIGANSTIDRATLGETRVRKGTKLDNLVHIGHNCRIGQNVILCAQVGIAGSVVIEDGVMCGGQAGLAQGITIGQGARLGAQCGVGTNVEAGGSRFLSPAMPMKDALRAMKYFRKLPEIWNRLRRLEEKSPT